MYCKVIDAMNLTLEEVMQATGAKILAQESSKEFSIVGVSTDTRAIERNDLFFALKGEKFDGHDFIESAFEKGVRQFVISDTKKVKPALKKAGVWLVVDDTLKSYGDLARYYRRKFRIPAVAITGSAGKTTVKEMTAHILSQQFKVLKNRGTENNLVGVPKTLFNLEDSHEAMVLEMGTNQPGEIERLSSIISPQIGIVTQIGTAHLEGLKSQEGIKEEKLKIIQSLERGGLLILNGQDPFLKDATSGVHKILRIGFQKDQAELVAEQTWCHEKGSTFHVNGDVYETPLIGRHNILNCLFAIAIAEAMGVEKPLIQKGIASFKAVPGRMSLKSSEEVLFIDDSYNSNPQSFKASLETLKEFKTHGKKIILCGDMLELGEHAEKYHRELGAMIAEMRFDYVIAAGDHSRYLIDGALEGGMNAKCAIHAKDSQEAGKLCHDIAKEGDIVLVKGSRGTKMEAVFNFFKDAK